MVAISALALIGFSLFAQQPSKGLEQLLKTVEDHYNHAQSMRLDFTEAYQGHHRPMQVESGVLYLKKPGKMRWEYADPAGKLFLSDGKSVILYSPEERRAEHGSLKGSDDERAPLAFLLGKLDFSKEFRNFQAKPDAGGTWVSAEPKSDKLAYRAVEFLAATDGSISRMRITVQDDSRLDFTFRNERANVDVPQSLFRFSAPAGVEMVEAGER